MTITGTILLTAVGFFAIVATILVPEQVPSTLTSVEIEQVASQGERPKTFGEKILDLDITSAMSEADIEEVSFIIFSAGITKEGDIVETFEVAAQFATVCDMHLKDAAGLIATFSVAFNEAPHEVANVLMADKELCEGVALKK